MHEIAGLLAKLKQIAGQRCSCDERTARAVALVSAFSAALYARLGIESSIRPTSSAKSIADQALVGLRQQILAAEMRRREPLRTTFTTARHRVEMERRVLAARIVAESDSPSLSAGDIVAQPQAGSRLNPRLAGQRGAARARLGSRSGQLTM